MEEKGIMLEENDYLSAIIAWGRARPILGQNDQVKEFLGLLERVERVTGNSPRSDDNQASCSNWIIVIYPSSVTRM